MKIVFKQMDDVEDVDSSVTIIVDKVKDSISIGMVNDKVIVYDTESGKTLFKDGVDVMLYDKGKKILHYGPRIINNEL